MPPLEGVVEGVAGVPVLGVPPVAEPPLEDPPLELPFLFFFVVLGEAGVPVVTGGVTGAIVLLLDFEPPPPLEAMAITTIRKNAAAARATSLRRR